MTNGQVALVVLAGVGASALLIGFGLRWLFSMKPGA